MSNWLSNCAACGEMRPCNCAIDPLTGRPYGDHGTAVQAIAYVLDTTQSAWTQETTFLKCWTEGELKDWPEFYVWLAQQEKR